MPYNFFHQVSKGPNIYYLFICVLQMIKPISITSGSPTNLPPLLFLMVVSMIKDYFEDRRRRKSDHVENTRSAIVIGGAKNGALVEQVVPWHALKTGQLVKVQKNEFFPADMVLLASSAAKNMCFIETKGLDGETNLKHKIAPKELSAYNDAVDMTRHFEGRMMCEPPSDQIYKFEGVIKTHLNDKISLSHENILLRGSSLRNTDWVIGVVVYTGHDTRIMRNSVKSKQKFSRLERMITKSILIIMLIEAIMCAVAGAFATVWNDVNAQDTASYLALNEIKGMQQSPWAWYTYIKIFFKTFFTWILLFTNMVPISLLVTVEIVKFAQAMFIAWDINIYDVDRDMPTRV